MVNIQQVRAAAILTAAGMAGTTGLLATAGTASAAVPTTAPTAAVATAAVTCGLGRWEAAVQGAPHFMAGDRGGDYLWHTSSGFSFRVTHRGDHRAVYTGEITANMPLHLSPVHLEKGDVVRLSADHRAILFAFVDHGYVDGIDFTTDCADQVTLSHLNVGDAPLPADRVQLGQNRVHPTALPVTITR
jgi:hypothetical protein